MFFQYHTTRLDKDLYCRVGTHTTQISVAQGIPWHSVLLWLSYAAAAAAQCPALPNHRNFSYATATPRGAIFSSTQGRA